MSDKPRPRPYVWVSWITKLLAGENRCWFAAWYKSHFKYDKTKDQECGACAEGRPCTDPENCRHSFFKEWTEKHDRITARAAEAYRESGWVVRVEDEGEFKLNGKGADLAGKPDLVAIKGGVAEVVDAKSGRRRASDHWQVLIYMFALPLAWLEGMRDVSGVVEYSDGPESVRALGTKERDAIVDAIRRVSTKDAPEPVPSAHECLRCDIASCTARHVARPGGDATRFF